MSAAVGDFVLEYERGRGLVDPTVLADSPCDNCQHAARCAAGLACRAMAHFVATGRISSVAQRHPSAAIYAQIYQPQPQAPGRPSTMLAISLLRANPCRMR
jgi:hypothetical protein